MSFHESGTRMALPLRIQLVLMLSFIDFSRNVQLTLAVVSVSLFAMQT